MIYVVYVACFVMAALVRGTDREALAAVGVTAPVHTTTATAVSLHFAGTIGTFDGVTLVLSAGSGGCSIISLYIPLII